MKKYPCFSPARRAFTLVEVLVAFSIFSLLSAGVIGFFMTNLRMSYMTTGKLLVGKDVRDFTNTLSDDGRTASSFKIYQSFSDRTEVFRGDSGDMMVFIHQVTDRLPNRDENGNPILVHRDRGDKYMRVVRLSGYYRNGLPGDDGAEVRFFSVDMTQLPPENDPYDYTVLVERIKGGLGAPPIDGPGGILETHLPAPETRGDPSHRVTLELSRGLAEGVLFYNFQGQSVIVRGEIIHPGNRQRRATNTYNFTVTPRG